MATVMMIASGKGGTGKSTFSAFLSEELAVAGKKTLLIELDAGLRSIDIITGAERQAVYDIGDVLAGRCTIEKAMLQSQHSKNLYIVAAPYRNFDSDFSQLKTVIDSLYQKFDYIIIDTAAGLGDAFYAAAKVAVIGIIVVTADAVSVRDGRLVSDELYDSGVKNIRLVVNKFSHQTFDYSGFEDLDEVIDAVCARLLGVIPFSQDIVVSSMRGTTLTPGRDKQIFSAIAQRIMGKDIQIIIK